MIHVVTGRKIKAAPKSGAAVQRLLKAYWLGCAALSAGIDISVLSWPIPVLSLHAPLVVSVPVVVVVSPLGWLSVSVGVFPLGV